MCRVNSDSRLGSVRHGSLTSDFGGAGISNWFAITAPGTAFAAARATVALVAWSGT